MSNNINTSPTIRWQLLSTVSALALIGSACAAEAAGKDADRPLIWIELGGQADNISGQGEVFVPAFLTANSTSPVFGPVTPLQAQRPPKFSFGEEGKISFQPGGSDWVFSAAARIGRSSNHREVDHQTNGTFHYKYKNGVAYGAPRTNEKFSDTKSNHQESHAILDFMAGKDVGLGMFGSSTFSGGIRMAQFTSRSTFDIRADPDLGFKYQTFGPFPTSAGSITFKFKLPHFHTYHATARASRSFHGIGPTLSWNASTPIAGTPDAGMTIDWGVNAAVLFGKQKANVSHHQTSLYAHDAGGALFIPYGQYYTGPGTSGGHHAARSVVVTNLGGFAGLSFRYSDAKISLGYRADFFFGAIDGGIDARKSETLGFKGPFASVSIGLGD